MTVHRECRDIQVLMQDRDLGSGEQTILGRGGSIQPGHTIETLYRGIAERWRVRAISMDDELCMWSAAVVPVPVLKLVS